MPDRVDLNDLELCEYLGRVGPPRPRETWTEYQSRFDAIVAVDRARMGSKKALGKEVMPHPNPRLFKGYDTAAGVNGAGARRIAPPDLRDQEPSPVIYWLVALVVIILGIFVALARFEVPL